MIRCTLCIDERIDFECFLLCFLLQYCYSFTVLYCTKIVSNIILFYALLLYLFSHYHILDRSIALLLFPIVQYVKRNGMKISSFFFIIYLTLLLVPCKNVHPHTVVRYCTILSRNECRCIVSIDSLFYWSKICIHHQLKQYRCTRMYY